MSEHKITTDADDYDSTPEQNYSVRCRFAQCLECGHAFLHEDRCPECYSREVEGFGSVVLTGGREGEEVGREGEEVGRE